MVKSDVGGHIENLAVGVFTRLYFECTEFCNFRVQPTTPCNPHYMVASAHGRNP